MRMIDADAYADELKMREKLCFYQIDNADVNATVSEVEYWSGVIGTFNEAMCVLADAPTVATNTLVTCAECKYRDAMELLKEQEPVEPRKILPCITRPVGGYVCGHCGIRFLEKNDYYCPNCGRKVKWDA